jgi:hypothetical protein
MHASSDEIVRSVCQYNVQTMRMHLHAYTILITALHLSFAAYQRYYHFAATAGVCAAAWAC